MKNTVAAVVLACLGLGPSNQACAQAATPPSEKIEFFSFVDGWNPTNAGPRPVRFGRAQFSLSNDVFRYEIILPVQYAPYTGRIRFFGFGAGHDVIVADFGALSCVPILGTITSADAADLELLPQCLTRGSVALTPQEIDFILSGASVLDIGRGGLTAGVWAPIIPVDSDHDGVPDFRDSCPNTLAGVVVNADGCSIEQLAPCASPWRNHGEYVNRVKQVTADFVRAGLITDSQRRSLLNRAAQSNCGG